APIAGRRLERLCVRLRIRERHQVGETSAGLRRGGRGVGVFQRHEIALRCGETPLLLRRSPQDGARGDEQDDDDQLCEPGRRFHNPYGNVWNVGIVNRNTKAAHHSSAAVIANGAKRGRSVLYCFISILPAARRSIAWMALMIVASSPPEKNSPPVFFTAPIHKSSATLRLFWMLPPILIK